MKERAQETGKDEDTHLETLCEEEDDLKMIHSFILVENSEDEAIRM